MKHQNQNNSDNAARNISYAEAINEAIYQLMEQDSSVFVMGLGVNDSGAVFGTTTKAAKEFPERVIGIPLAENGLTGVALGAAAGGMRPIFTHQRMDFMLTAMDQIVNHLAKWEFMMAGKSKAPITIRSIIGRAVGGGWGQASQHAQSLQVLFSHIPGLNVVMPYSAYDAKGLLISCVRSSHPTFFIEHRSVHKEKGAVPAEMYEVPIGKAKKIKEGRDITIIGLSAMNMEIKKAVEELEKLGVDAEWIDLRSVKPWDREVVFSSVEKTRRLVFVSTDHKSFGVSAEIVCSIAEEMPQALKSVKRISLPDSPIPAGPAIEKEYYPNFVDVVNASADALGLESPFKNEDISTAEKEQIFKDVF